MDYLAIAAIPADRAGLVIGGIIAAWLVGSGLLAWRREAGLAATAMMALGVSLYLGKQHASAAGESICSISATFDCDLVNRSPYSEIGGIPVAILGAGFYAAVLLVVVLRMMRPERYGRAAHLVLLGAALSVAYSAFLGWISFRMGTWCLFCISLYGFNLLLFAGSLLLARRAEVPLVQGISEGLQGTGDNTLWGMLIAGSLAFVGGMVVYRSLGDGSTAAAAGPTLSLNSLYVPVSGTIELRGNEPVLGNATAAYTVVEFADFQCPSCADAVPDALAMVEREPDVRLMFKHYPISGTCNENVQGVRHDKACNAAAAAECARQQGRFWEMEKLMFKNQEFLAPDDVLFMARQVGLDVEALQACIADPATLATIKSDVAQATRMGLEYTPSFFLKGIAGDAWVLVKGGGPEAALLIDAHQAGQKF